VLEGGEEGVEVLDRGDAAGEGLLEGERWQWNKKVSEQVLTEVWLRSSNSFGQERRCEVLQ
jgi:hypothetical protein